MNEEKMKKAHAKKLKRAKKVLGERYVLHPVNRVMKNQPPRPVMIPNFLRAENGC